MTTLKIDDIVINPRTNRPVKVGGTTYRKLVREGVLDAEEFKYTDPHELGELPTTYKEMPQEQVDAIIKQYNDRLPINQHAVRGRGRHKGKVVRRVQKVEPRQMKKFAAKTATRVIAENIDRLSNAGENDIVSMLESMILAELEKEQTPTRESLKPRAKAQPQPSAYTLMKPEDIESESESELEAHSETELEAHSGAELEAHSEQDEYW